MLNLNDDAIKSEGGSFDASKIFGYSVVKDNVITDTLDGAVIVGFSHGISQTGSKFWDIQMKDGNGNENNMREYDVDMTRDGWEKKQASQLKRLKHILSKFVPAGTALPQAATFPELWTAIEGLMVANQCNTKPVRLKLVYNNKGYLIVPAYVPFMESMTVVKAQSSLKLNPEFDTLTRPSADKPADKMVASGGSSDIPFVF